MSRIVNVSRKPTTIKVAVAIPERGAPGVSSTRGHEHRDAGGGPEYGQRKTRRLLRDRVLGAVCSQLRVRGLHPCRDRQQQQRDRPCGAVGDVADLAVRLQQVEAIAERVRDQRHTRDGQEPLVLLREDRQTANSEREEQQVAERVGHARGGRQGRPAGRLQHRMEHKRGGQRCNTETRDESVE